MKIFGVCSAIVAMFLPLATAGAQPVPVQRPGTVYRGVVDGGIWIEIASDGAGQVELAILDGLPNGSPDTLYVKMNEERGNNNCVLKAASENPRINGCPQGVTYNTTLTLGQLNGRVSLQQVGWEGSFAWPSDVVDVTAIKQQCGLQRLNTATGLANAPLKPILSALSESVSALDATGSNLKATLPRLRSDRLRAYSVIALTQSEQAQSQRVTDGIAGRVVFGQVVSLAQATREKLAFDTSVANSPARTRARADLLQVDRSLSEIYDPSASIRRRAALTQIKTVTWPSAKRALQDTLALRLPTSMNDLLALETSVAELDACAVALGDGNSITARLAVRASLAARADELAALLQANIASASDANAARAVLLAFEANPVISNALRTGGQAGVLNQAKIRIAQLTQAEDQARQAAQRAANAQMASNSVPVGTQSGGQLQASRVAGSIFKIFAFDSSGNGGVGTGFAVAPSIIVTNVHVVAGASNIVAVPNNSGPRQQQRATVIARYPIHDVAILRLDGSGGRPLAIASTAPGQGSKIWVMGFPGAADSVQIDRTAVASLSDGIVSRILPGETTAGRNLGNTTLLQHTAETSGGNSGSPVLDGCQRVVGVHFMGISREGAKFNFATLATVLPELLRQAGINPTVSAGRCG
jgi:S1-C subfamily serine protease